MVILLHIRRSRGRPILGLEIVVQDSLHIVPRLRFVLEWFNLL